jgi:hypothetical protein
VQQAAPAQPAAATQPASAGAPFVIRVSALRPCRVRIVVDGTALDWREMKKGDQFESRPEHEIAIESTDAGALAATVDGEPVSLGADGRNATFHLAVDSRAPASSSGANRQTPGVLPRINIPPK